MRYLLFLLLLAACTAESTDPYQYAADRVIAGTSVPVFATNVSTGNEGNVAADVADGFLTRAFSPETGWHSFPDCFVDTDFNGECIDDEGNTWIFEGATSLDDKNGDEADDNPPAP